MSIFGWDLPPGVTSRMIDESMGIGMPCEVCGHDCDRCICPECPTCGTHGDPVCYALGPVGHGLTLTPDQEEGAARLRDWQNQQDAADAAYGDDMEK